jgi:hypothetical protein
LRSSPGFCNNYRAGRHRRRQDKFCVTEDGTFGLGLFISKVPFAANRQQRIVETAIKKWSLFFKHNLIFEKFIN